MAKTKEELNQLKKEYQNFKTKLSELTEDEIKEIVGGFNVPGGPEQLYEKHFYDNDLDTKEDFKNKF